MSTLMKFIFGPRLYKIYKIGDREGQAYQANVVESYSNVIINSISIMWSISIYTSPVIAAVLYKKGYFTPEGSLSCIKFAGVLGFLIWSAVIFRGFGRYANKEYATFLTTLENAKKNLNRQTKLDLSKYDFEFSAWPVEFRWDEFSGSHDKPKVQISSGIEPKGVFQAVLSAPCEILSYVAINTFGWRMIYPGAVKLLQMAVAPLLTQGRSSLIEEHKGERFKLLSRDNNDIDTMFIDRRSTEPTQGKTLVICCEGNAGFYEYGIMVTPLQSGYSVLGWNHPGFAGSSGIPFPDQETNAIDAVMQFAINKLGFLPENIIIFAWSIGGFPASWVAMNYPDIKGLILDATFDDILPLAEVRMPTSWRPLVRCAIRRYMNLNNVEALYRYPGPLLMIRRVRDEILNTDESNILASNTGNALLKKLFIHRYPCLMTTETLSLLNEWLERDQHQQSLVWAQYGVEEDYCLATIRSYIEEHSGSFPMKIGLHLPDDLKKQLVLYLASNYMVDYNSTHCTPLPVHYFSQPWSPETQNSPKHPLHLPDVETEFS